MEPPRHDAFEPDRLPPDRRQAGKTALRELAEWVRKMLARHAKDPVTEETKLDELADLFGDEDEGGAPKQKDENPGGPIVVRARQVKVKSPGAPIGGSAASVDNEEGDGEGKSTETNEGSAEADGKGGEGQGGTNDQTGGTAAGSGGGSEIQQRTLSSGLALSDVRAVPLDGRRRRVGFTPRETGSLLIELQDSGADTNYALAIVATNKGNLASGRIENVAVVAGVRCTIEVELEREFEGTLRVVANAV